MSSDVMSDSGDELAIQAQPEQSHLHDTRPSSKRASTTPLDEESGDEEPLVPKKRRASPKAMLAEKGKGKARKKGAGKGEEGVGSSDEVDEEGNPTVKSLRRVKLAQLQVSYTLFNPKGIHKVTKLTKYEKIASSKPLDHTYIDPLKVGAMSVSELKVEVVRVVGAFDAKAGKVLKEGERYEKMELRAWLEKSPMGKTKAMLINTKEDMDEWVRCICEKQWQGKKVEAGLRLEDEDPRPKQKAQRQAKTLEQMVGDGESDDEEDQRIANDPAEIRKRDIIQIVADLTAKYQPNPKYDSGFPIFPHPSDPDSYFPLNHQLLAVWAADIHDKVPRLDKPGTFIDDCTLPARHDFRQSLFKRLGSHGRDGAAAGSGGNSGLSAENVAQIFLALSGAKNVAAAPSSTPTPATNHPPSSPLPFPALELLHLFLDFCRITGQPLQDAKDIFAAHDFDDAELLRDKAEMTRDYLGQLGFKAGTIAKLMRGRDDWAGFHVYLKEKTGRG